jgi:glutathione S-transferase
MAFRLHGFPQSTCTRRVAHIARERNIPYEVVLVNPAVGEHKQPPHLAHQPFGQVPYVVVRRLYFESPPAIVAAAAYFF